MTQLFCAFAEPDAIGLSSRLDSVDKLQNERKAAASSGGDRDALPAPPPPPPGSHSYSLALDQQAARVLAAPMIARSAQLTLSTREFDKTRAGLDEILKRHSGYIGDLNVSSPLGTERRLTATLRVPADQLDATLDELKRLGRVESESQSGEEVTAQFVDLEARLANARNTEQRLTEVLRKQAGKLADILAVEVEISRVRGEIESMEAERKTLLKRVDYATLNATITENYRAQMQVVPPSIGMQLRNAAIQGYKSMIDAAVGLLLFLIGYGPSILLWVALLFFPLRFFWRRVRSGRTPRD